MEFLRNLILADLIWLFAGVPTFAFEKTAQGILVNVGEAHAELASAKPGIFRLSVSYDGIPRPAPSIFLDTAPASTGETVEAVTLENKVGIKTSSGELLIDPSNGRWTLLNSTGKALVTQGTLGGIEKGDEPRGEKVTFDLGLGKNKPLHLYGNGNGTRDLLKTTGDSHMDNGIAVIPYYWCDAGYGAFGVTGDDDRPARWNLETKAGKITWSFPGRTADLYLMPAEDLRQAAQKYADLTGHPKVSPKWAFGYLQSRWGWTDKAYIDKTLKTFRDDKLPVDAFIFDFECYAQTPDYELKPEGQPHFTDFNWNPTLFPDAAKKIADDKAQGIQIIPIRKPRIGNSDTLKMMREKGWILVTGKNGEKGLLMDSRDINFENPEVRDWYGEQAHQMIDDGVGGWWNDEGESVYTKYYYWNLAEYDALAKFKPGQRHWSINRAFQPGMERLGASAWTGDIKTDWKTLGGVPANLLNWSLAGMPYGGCDIGGFTGPSTPEMLTRWMQAGVFMPVMRAHSVNTVDPRFPWLYGKDAENAIRQALDLRYRLVPFYYSLAHEAYETGVPIMRPMVMEFPDDPKVANITDEWLMGTGLMAAPILAEGGKRTIYFPEGTWYKFDTGEIQPGGKSIKVTAPLDGIPTYVRAGTILTLGPVVQYTGQLPGGPLDVQVYSGKDADFTLVEDDGKTYDYLKGQLRKTAFHWDDTARTLTWKEDGPYQGTDVFQKLHLTVFDKYGKKEADADLSATGSSTLK